MHSYVRVLQSYMDALGRSDYGTVKSLFTPGGQVKSPFLGDMPAGPFFDRLAGASAKNVITPIDIFLSSSGKNHATAYFQYDWTAATGPTGPKRDWPASSTRTCNRLYRSGLDRLAACRRA